MLKMFFASLLSALLLAACGGGSTTPFEQEVQQANAIVARNRALYEQIQKTTDPASRATLVAEFNANVARFMTLSLSARQPDCGTQKGREAAHAECIEWWARATTPLTQ